MAKKSVSVVASKSSKSKAKKVMTFVAPKVEKPSGKVWLVNRFEKSTDYDKFVGEIEKTGNASEVARKYGFNPLSVGQLARRLGIELRSPGRPSVYQYDKTKVLPKVKKALEVRGGLVKLSKELKLPYQTLRKLAERHEMI